MFRRTCCGPACVPAANGPLGDKLKPAFHLINHEEYVGDRDVEARKQGCHAMADVVVGLTSAAPIMLDISGAEY